MSGALENGEDIVGGSVCGAEPESDWEAVTRALDTSRFCGGAAPFRNGGEARYVDTLAYALYRREVYDRVGLYDERLRRTEDNDMHYRMRKAGYRFYFSPDILSWHAARKTLRGQLQSKMGQRLLDWPHDAHPAPLLCPPSSDSCAVCAGSRRPAGGFSAVGASALRDAPVVRHSGYRVRRKSRRRSSARQAARFSLPALSLSVVHIVYGVGTICGLLTGKASEHA